MRRSLLRDSLLRAHARRRQEDAGFTLLEVIIAIVLLGIVAAAAGPILITGMRSSISAKYLTQAHLLAQERVDVMRNLPFNVPPTTGPYIDVLDNYFTNATAPTSTPTCTAAGSGYAIPATSWSGFVAATGGTRCGYEPNGALYRKVIKLTAPYAGFTEVVDTQFLDANRQPVAPAPCGYDTQSTDPCKYTPITELLGVTVSVLYNQFGKTKAYSYFSEITDNGNNQPLIVSSAHSAAVKAVLGTSQGRLTVTAGETDQKGELFNAPLVNAGGTAMETDFGGVTPTNGAVAATSAPPDVSGISQSGAALDPYSSLGSCVFVCWGPNYVNNLSASTSTRVPLAGTPGAPVTSYMPSSATTMTGAAGFQVSNENLNTAGLLLDPTKGLVRFDNGSGSTQSASNCTFANAGANTLFQGTSYLNATNGNSTHLADACATAQTMTLDVLPTTFAPNGLLQVTLQKASAECKINVAGGTATASSPVLFNATVRVNAQSGSFTRTVTSGTSQGDILSQIPLSTVVYTNGATTLRLSDYFQAMNSTPDGKVVTTTTNRDTQVDLPGIVLLTQPLQDPSAATYATSIMSLEIGSLSCEAEDLR